MEEFAEVCLNEFIGATLITHSTFSAPVTDKLVGTMISGW